jgi:hypothetical protein
MVLPPTFIMSSQEKRNSMPIQIICWWDGIVKSLIDEKLRAKSKSVGLQHAMDILGESSSSKNEISQYLSIREGASDKRFTAKLPPRIEPGNILESSQPPPQM